MNLSVVFMYQDTEIIKKQMGLHFPGANVALKILKLSVVVHLIEGVSLAVSQVNLNEILSCAFNDPLIKFVSA